MPARPYIRSALTLASRRVGLTGPELAARLGVSPVTITYWAGRTSPIPSARVPQLAKALRITEDEVRAMSRDVVPAVALRVALERGVSPAQLVELTGLRRQVLVPMLNGQRAMPPYAARALEEVLGLPAEYLAAPDTTPEA